MRLDLFLKKTAIIKRRTVAKELTERGHMFINDKLAKPSSDVRDGDVILLNLGNRRIKVKAIIEIKKDKEIPNFEILEQIKMGEQWHILYK